MSKLGLFIALFNSSIAFGFVIRVIWYFPRVIAKLLALFLLLKKIADVVPIP